MQVIGGILEVTVDGESIDISVDAVEINFGLPLLEPIMGGHGRVVGAKSTPQAPMISGQMHVTDFERFVAFAGKRNATVSGRTGAGTFVVTDAFFSSEGNVSSDEMKTPFKFVGSSARFI